MKVISLLFARDGHRIAAGAQRELNGRVVIRVITDAGDGWLSVPRDEARRMAAALLTAAYEAERSEGELVA